MTMIWHFHRSHNERRVIEVRESSPVIPDVGKAGARANFFLSNYFHLHYSALPAPGSESELFLKENSLALPGAYLISKFKSCSLQLPDIDSRLNYSNLNLQTRQNERRVTEMNNENEYQVKFTSTTRRSLFTWTTRISTSPELPGVQVSLQLPALRFPSQLFDNCVRY